MFLCRMSFKLWNYLRFVTFKEAGQLRDSSILIEKADVASGILLLCVTNTRISLLRYVLHIVQPLYYVMYYVLRIQSNPCTTLGGMCCNKYSPIPLPRLALCVTNTDQPLYYIMCHTYSPTPLQRYVLQIQCNHYKVVCVCDTTLNTVQHLYCLIWFWRNCLFVDIFVLTTQRVYSFPLLSIPK